MVELLIKCSFIAMSLSSLCVLRVDNKGIVNCQSQLYLALLTYCDVASLLELFLCFPPSCGIMHGLGLREMLGSPSFRSSFHAAEGELDLWSFGEHWFRILMGATS